MNRSLRNFAELILTAGPLTVFSPVIAENIVFPQNSGIINVVSSGVDNTGRTDVTAKLSQILTGNQKNVIIYFPNGTYRVSGRVRGPHDPSFTPSAAIHGPLIMGQSRTGTVIRLADGTWPIDTLDFPKLGNYPHLIDDQVVLHTGDCGNTTFQRQVRNLTVNIGKNNDGATGVVFIASNSGCMADVDIISEDGKGCIGLSMSGSENGPVAVHNVHVKGFKRGVYCAVPDVLSMSQMVIEGASEYGLVNVGVTALDSIKTTLRAPAVLNILGGSLCLLNGYFDGGASDTAAVFNYGKLFARNLHSTGYKRALKCKDWGNAQREPPMGNLVLEYVSRDPQGLFNNPGVSMNLPVKYPAYPAWEQDMTKWTNPVTYKTSSNTWTDAFKSALSQAGKTSMVIPWNAYPYYSITDTLRIGGTISRVVGTTGNIENGQGAIIVGDGSTPVVILQSIAVNSATVPVIIRTSRLVILESVYGHIIVEGTGDVFINDLMGDVTIKNPAAHVWARKLNAEWGSTGTIMNAQAGTLWILGFKSENEQMKINCTAQGIVELFSFLNYDVGAGRSWPAGVPLFRIQDGNFCAIDMQQVSHGAISDSLLVAETRGGVTRYLTKANNPDMYNCEMYTGFDPSKFKSAVGMRPLREALPVKNGDLQVTRLQDGNLRISFTLYHPSPIDVRFADMQGRTVRCERLQGACQTQKHAYMFDTQSPPAGTYSLIVGMKTGKRFERLVIVDR